MRSQPGKKWEEQNMVPEIQHNDYEGGKDQKRTNIKVYNFVKYIQYIFKCNMR